MNMHLNLGLEDKCLCHIYLISDENGAIICFDISISITRDDLQTEKFQASSINPLITPTEAAFRFVTLSALAAKIERYLVQKAN